MFEFPAGTRPAIFVLLKRLCLVGLGLYLVIGLMAAYRAWFQVASLDVTITGFGGVYRPNDSREESVVSISRGSTIEATVVSYARTQIDVRLELIQGTHAETLLFQTVPDNDWAFFDPRTRRASFTATLTDEVLKRFRPGPAQFRATAVGRPQWTRLPPPIVREMTIQLRQE